VPVRLSGHALNFPNHLNPAHPPFEKRDPLSAQILEARPEAAGVFAVRVAVGHLCSRWYRWLCDTGQWLFRGLREVLGYGALAGEAALLCRHALNLPNHLNPAHPHFHAQHPYETAAQRTGDPAWPPVRC